MAAKKWDRAAAVAGHLVKVDPENEAWWINLAYSVRRSEGVEKAEEGASDASKDCNDRFNLPCYAKASQAGSRRQKGKLVHGGEKSIRAHRHYCFKLFIVSTAPIPETRISGHLFMTEK